MAERVKYESIIPATGWFFCADSAAGKIVYPLAAWAQAEEGGVFGLVSVPGGGDDNVMGKICRLNSVPPIRGVYKIQAELTEEELQRLTKPA